MTFERRCGGFSHRWRFIILCCIVAQKQEQRQLAKEQMRQKSKSEKDDKVNGDRPDSVNSSTATSVGTATPPSISGEALITLKHKLVKALKKNSPCRNSRV